MIISTITLDQRFVRTYSDEGYYIVRNDREYIEAYDPIGTGRQYYESLKKIPESDLLPEQKEKEEASQ